MPAKGCSITMRDRNHYPRTPVKVEKNFYTFKDLYKEARKRDKKDKNE